MSVRAPSVFAPSAPRPQRSQRLRDVLNMGVAYHTPQQGVEYDVLDSSGRRFGSATATTLARGGHVFVTPIEMRGVGVCAPVVVTNRPNSRVLATTLAEVLGTELGR